MLFASFDFLLFFLPVLLAYWMLARARGASLVLLLFASYFFYVASARPASGPPPTPWYFVALLSISTLVDYLAALLIASSSRRLGRNLWLWVSLIVNLGLLGYFKYTGFLLEVGSLLAAWVGIGWAAPSLHILLPIGISFYTFQSLSYTIDVWRGRLTPEPSLLRFALYVSFFPQLVAGPIVRASEFLPQFRNARSLTTEDVNFAAWRIIKGLVKKVILGDFIAAYFTDLVFASPTEYSSLENLLALYAFTLQIYADFSGYSDMAIGVARLLGFRLPENFDRPYQATNIGEFWRRWHITLSSWLRDYLFFPLGGSRGSSARTYVNLWITMFLVGMWHGASWNFVIYSNLQAAAMLYNRFHRLRRGSLGRQLLSSALVSGVAGLGCLWLGLSGLGLGQQAVPFAAGCAWLAMFVGWLPEGRFWRGAHVLMTFHFCVLSRLFFRTDDLDKARQMAGQLMAFDGLGIREGLFRLQGFRRALGALPAPAQTVLSPIAEWGVLLLLLVGIAYHFTPASWVDVRGLSWVSRRSAPVLALVLAGLFMGLSQLLSGPRANIYFAF